MASRPPDTSISPPAFNDKPLLIVTVLLGVIFAWLGRFAMISDGISYLDLGDAYLRGDWAMAANAYWSPMYACLLGVAMRILRPSIWWEFPVVHLVNFVAFLAALFSFRYFLQNLLRGDEESPEDGRSLRVPDWAVWGIGYGLFVWYSLVLIGIEFISPDLLLSAWVFLFAGLLLQLRTEVSYARFAALGFVLGAAYLTKGAMFPLSIVFLGIALFAGKLTMPRVVGVVLATVLFALVAAPLVLLLSRAKERLTFGDTGKLAYAWKVSPGASPANWQGGPDPAEIPLHPTRQLLTYPALYEFAEPVGGTYPPWYDPSYWNDGLRPRFNFRSQVRAFLQSLVKYGDLLTNQLGLMASMLTLILFGGRSALKSLLRHWPLLTIGLAALGLYSLVWVLPRYVGVFVVLSGIALVAGLRLPHGPNLDGVVRAVAIAAIITTGLTPAQALFEKAYQAISGGHSYMEREPMRAAEGLFQLGLKPGARVAVITPGITDFWARLGRFKIVCQIESPSSGSDEFWNSSQPQKEEVYAVMARTGARAVVTWNSTGADLGPGWQRLPGTFYHAHLLPELAK
jgi:hypothetical protein